MPEVKRKSAKNEEILFGDFVVEKEASGLSKNIKKSMLDSYLKTTKRNPD